MHFFWQDIVPCIIKHKHPQGPFWLCQFLVHLSRRLKYTINDHTLSIVQRPALTFQIYVISSETAERNLMKLVRKESLNVLYQVCVFRADRKNKMVTLASDWLRHFPLLLWNRWTELNETWLEARSQCPLQSFCFFGRSEKQDGHPGLNYQLYSVRVILWAAACCYNFYCSFTSIEVDSKQFWLVYIVF